MPKIKQTIAAIDDEEDILKTFSAILKPSYNFLPFSVPEKAIEKIKETSVDLVLLDIRMPHSNGIEILKKIKELDDDIEVIMVTALNDSKNAIAAMKSGAFDYINKPFDVDELLGQIKKALERKSLIKENRAFKNIIEESFGDITGRSDPMKKLFDAILKIAPSDASVLITGETGTGKEAVAKAIHKNSLRKNKPIVALNCAAIVESLFESELFGHERGAFTGALERHLGKFELADGGTLFLDEIGALSLPMQAKLLRVLQEEEIERVGGSRAIPINVRLICATNVDLKEAVKKKEFREDLYFRLNVLPIHIAPLRQRAGDIILLAYHFLEKMKKKVSKKMLDFDEEVIDVFKHYRWPGNVREMENIIERIVTLSSNQIIQLDDLPKEMQKQGGTIEMELRPAILDFEKRYIESALSEALGNQTKAAQMLGIDRTTLISKMRKLL